VLGLHDQRLDLAESRVVAGLGDPDVHRAGQVVRAGEDLHARNLVDGQRLAGDRRFVDGAQAGGHLAVGRDVVTRTDTDQVPRLQRADLDLLFDAVGADEIRPGRRQFDQRLDGRTRAQRGAGLNQFAEQHEEADQSGRHIFAGGERRHDAQRRQLIHVRFASNQAQDRMDDDRQPQQQRAEHGEDLGVEAVGSVDEAADAAVDQEDPARQSPQQRETDAQLLASGLLGGVVLQV